MCEKKVIIIDWYGIYAIIISDSKSRQSVEIAICIFFVGQKYPSQCGMRNELPKMKWAYGWIRVFFY